MTITTIMTDEDSDNNDNDRSSDTSNSKLTKTMMTIRITIMTKALMTPRLFQIPQTPAKTIMTSSNDNNSSDTNNNDKDNNDSQVVLDPKDPGKCIAVAMQQR